MKTRNSAWIPAVFTALYVGAAIALVGGVQASDAANPHSWFKFGELLAYGAIMLVPAWILVLWILYGTIWLGHLERGDIGLFLTGIFCPVAVTIALFVLLRVWALVSGIVK